MPPVMAQPPASSQPPLPAAEAAAAAAAAASGGGWVCVGHASSLAGVTGRLHACVQGRYLTVLRLRGRLTCIDSICFHAGGPLGLGDIEDVQGRPCLVCPWHSYKIDAFSGEKYNQGVTWQDGKMQPGEWKSNGVRQRTHEVREGSDGSVYVRLDAPLSSGAVASDEYASNAACGARVLDSPNTPGGNAAAAAGADGRRTGAWLRGRLERRR